MTHGTCFALQAQTSELRPAEVARARCSAGFPGLGRSSPREGSRGSGAGRLVTAQSVVHLSYRRPVGVTCFPKGRVGPAGELLWLRPVGWCGSRAVLHRHHGSSTEEACVFQEALPPVLGD